MRIRGQREKRQPWVLKTPYFIGNAQLQNDLWPLVQGMLSLASPCQSGPLLGWVTMEEGAGNSRPPPLGPDLPGFCQHQEGRILEWPQGRIVLSLSCLCMKYSKISVFQFPCSNSNNHK